MITSSSAAPAYRQSWHWGAGPRPGAAGGSQIGKQLLAKNYPSVSRGRRIKSSGVFSPSKAAGLAASYSQAGGLARTQSQLAQGLWKQTNAANSAQSLANRSDYYTKVKEQLGPWDSIRNGQSILGGLLW